MLDQKPLRVRAGLVQAMQIYHSAVVRRDDQRRLGGGDGRGQGLRRAEWALLKHCYAGHGPDGMTRRTKNRDAAARLR